MGVGTLESQGGCGAKRSIRAQSGGVGVTERGRARSFAQQDLWSTPVFGALSSELWARPWIKQRQAWGLEKAQTAVVTGWGCRDRVLEGASRGRDRRGETVRLETLVFILQAAGPGRGRAAKGHGQSRRLELRGENTTSPGTGGDLNSAPCLVLHGLCLI